jgi:hypothetical protein
MLAVDFFTVETMWLQRLYVLFFIERRSGTRLVFSVATVSVVWFTSTSWRRDQICEPYRQAQGSFERVCC